MAAYSFLQAATDDTNLTTYTFSAQNLGTADADRYIVCAYSSRGSGSVDFSSITIGGVTATAVCKGRNFSTNTTISGLVIAAVPTGTSGDVVVTFSAGMLRCAIALYRLVGIDSATASDSDTSTADDPTVNLDVPAGGYAIGTAATASTGPTAWTGITERYDTAQEAVFNSSSASDEFASVQTGLTMTADFTLTSVAAGAFASWAPAAAGGQPAVKRQGGVGFMAHGGYQPSTGRMAW